MSLDGGKLIQLDADGIRGEEFIAKGRKFTVGYYMSCDVILRDGDKGVKGVHCEIKCDAFGRVTVHNLSDEHPILVNEHVVSDKRPLLNGTRLKILEKDYLWEFPKTVSCEYEQLNTPEPVTPTSQFDIQQPLPNSCPDVKNKVHLDNRLTFHNFAFSIQSNEEGNSSSDSNEDPNDNVSATDNEGAEPERLRCRTPEIKVTLNSTVDTPKVNLLDATKNKENSNSLKKRNLLSYCKQSDIAITSYSPRTAGVCIERSFTKLIKPSAYMSTTQTPKSFYGTPQSGVGGVLVELNDDSISRDFIDFSTPTTSRMLATAPNKSMHLIDLTTPSRLRPILKGEIANSLKRNYTPQTDSVSNSLSQKSSGSVISVDSSSPSIIEVGSSVSINSPVSSRNLQHKTPGRFVGATPKRTPQSLMKRALLTSAKKQVLSRLKMASPLTPNNAAARESLIATRRQSLTTPTSKIKGLMDSTHKDDQLLGRLQLSASGISRKLPTSTPVRAVGTLRHRESLIATSPNSHSSRGLSRVSLALSKRVSPTSLSSKLVAKARKSLCLPRLSPTSVRARALSYAGTKSSAGIFKRNNAHVEQLSSKNSTPTTDSLGRVVQKGKKELTKAIAPAISEEGIAPGDLRLSPIKNSVDDSIAETSQMKILKDVSTLLIQTKQVELTSENLQTDSKLTEKSAESFVTDESQQNELSRTFLIEDSDYENDPKTSQKQSVLNVTFSPEPAKRAEKTCEHKVTSTEEDTDGETKLLLSKIDQVLNKSDEHVLSDGDTDESLDNDNIVSNATELDVSSSGGDSVEVKDSECVASESNNTLNGSSNLKPDTKTSKEAKGEEQLNDVESTTTVDVDQRNVHTAESTCDAKIKESSKVVNDGTCIATASTTMEESAEAAYGADKSGETVELGTSLNEARELVASVDTECADRAVESLNLEQSREIHTNDGEVQPVQEVESSIQMNISIEKSDGDMVEFSRVESDSRTSVDEGRSENLNGPNSSKDNRVENDNVVHVDDCDPKMESEIPNSSGIKEANVSQAEQNNAADALLTEEQVINSLETGDEARTDYDLKDDLEVKEVPAELARAKDTDISLSLGGTNIDVALSEIETSAIEEKESQHIETSLADDVHKKHIPIEQVPKTPRRSMRRSSSTITLESNLSEEKSNAFTPRRSLRRASMSIENNQSLATPTRTVKRRASCSTADSTQNTPRSNAKRRQSNDARLPTVTSTPINAKTTRKLLLMDETIGDMAVIVEEDDSELPETTENKVPPPDTANTNQSRVTIQRSKEIIEESICEEVTGTIDATKHTDDLLTSIPITVPNVRDESFCQAAELEDTPLKSPANESKETQLEPTSPNLDIQSHVSKTCVPTEEDYGVEVLPSLQVSAVQLESAKGKELPIIPFTTQSNVETAVGSTEIDFKGMRELLKTPKSCRTPLLKGMRELLKTPKITATPLLGGLKEMVRTPSDTKEASPFNVTVNTMTVDERLTKRSFNQTEDDEGLDKFFKTPRAKNVMIPNDPASAVLQKREESDTPDHGHVTVYDLNSTNTAMQLGKLFETPVSSRFPLRLQDDEADAVESKEMSFEKSKYSIQKTTVPLSETPKLNLLAEEAFDSLVGLPSIFQTPVGKVYQRKTKSSTDPPSPFSASDVISDLPKTDIQEWVDSLEDTSVENVSENEVTIASASLQGEDPLSLSKSGIKDESNQEESPKSSMKVFIPANDSVNVTNASEKLMNVSTHSSLRDPLTSTAYKSIYEPKEETDESRPTSFSDANMSGIQLLDATTESIMEPLLVSCNDSLNATLEETTPAYMLKDKAANQTEVHLLDEDNACTNDLEEPLVVSEDDVDDIVDNDKNTTERLANITSESSLQLTDSSKKQMKETLNTTDVQTLSDELTLVVASDVDETEDAATTFEQSKDGTETNRHTASTGGANISTAAKEFVELLEDAEASNKNLAMPNLTISNGSVLANVNSNSEEVVDQNTSKTLDTLKIDDDKSEENLTSAIVEENKHSEQALSKKSEMKGAHVDEEIGDKVNNTEIIDNQTAENLVKITTQDLNNPLSEINKSTEFKSPITNNDLKNIEAVVIADDEIDSDSNEAKTEALTESIEIFESDDENVEDKSLTSKIVEGSQTKAEEETIVHETKKTSSYGSPASKNVSSMGETEKEVTNRQTANLHSNVVHVESEDIIEIKETAETKISTKLKVTEQMTNNHESEPIIANCEVNSYNASSEIVSPVAKKVDTFDNKEASRCLPADNEENVENMSKIIIETPSEAIVETDNALHNNTSKPIAVELELAAEGEPSVVQLITNLDEIESNCSAQVYTEDAIETICLDDTSNETSMSSKSIPLSTIDLGTSSSVEAILVINNTDSEELTTDSETSIQINTQTQARVTGVKESLKYNKELSQIEASEEKSNTESFNAASATVSVDMQATSEVETAATAREKNETISIAETQSTAEDTTQESACLEMQATDGDEMLATTEEAATDSESAADNIVKDSEEDIAEQLLKVEEILPEKVNTETQSNDEEALFEATKSNAHGNSGKEEMFVIDEYDTDTTTQVEQPAIEEACELVEPPREDKQLESSSIQRDLVAMAVVDISKKRNNSNVNKLESIATHADTEVISSPETSESVQSTDGNLSVIQPEQISEVQQTNNTQATNAIQEPIILKINLIEQKLNLSSSKRRRKSSVEVEVQDARTRRRERIPSIPVEEAKEMIGETPAKLQEGKRHRRKDRTPSEEPSTSKTVKDVNESKHKTPLRNEHLASVALEPHSKLKEDLQGSLALVVKPILSDHTNITEKSELNEAKILDPSVSAFIVSNIDAQEKSQAILDISEVKEQKSAANVETIPEAKMQAASISLAVKPIATLLQENTEVSSVLEVHEKKVHPPDVAEKQSTVDKNLEATFNNTSEVETIKSARRGRKPSQTVEETSSTKLVELKSTRRGRKPSASETLKSTISKKVDTKMLVEEKGEPIFETLHKKSPETSTIKESEKTVESKEQSELAASTTTNAVASDSALLHDEKPARRGLISSNATETSTIPYQPTNIVQEATPKRTTRRIREHTSIVDPIVKLRELPRSVLNIHGAGTSSSTDQETKAKDIQHKKPITRRGRKISAFEEKEELSKADLVVDSQSRKPVRRGRTPASAALAVEEKHHVTDEAEAQKLTPKSSTVLAEEAVDDVSADTKLAKRSRKVLKATIKVVDEEEVVAHTAPSSSETHEDEQPKPIRRGRTQGKSREQLVKVTDLKKGSVPQVPTDEKHIAIKGEIDISPTTSKPVVELHRLLTPGALLSRPEELLSPKRESRRIPKLNYDETSDDEAHPTKSSNAEQIETTNEDELVSPKREGRNLPRRNYDETSGDEKNGVSGRSRRARKPTSKVLQLEAERGTTPKRYKAEDTDETETPQQPSSSRRIRGGRKIKIAATTDSNEEPPHKREAPEPSKVQQQTTTTNSSGGDGRRSVENVQVLVASKAVSRSRRKPAAAQPEAKDLTDKDNGDSGEVKTSTRSRVIKRKPTVEFSEETEVEPPMKKSSIVLPNSSSRTKRAAATKKKSDTDLNENEADESSHAPASVVETVEVKDKPAAKATTKRGVRTKAKAALHDDNGEEGNEPQSKKAATEPKSSRTRATVKAKKDVDIDEDTAAHIPAVKPRGRGRKASADRAPKAVTEAVGIKSSLRTRGKHEVAIAINLSSDELDDNESVSSTSVKDKIKKRIRGKAAVMAVEAAPKPELSVSEQESPPVKAAASSRPVRGRKVHFQATESETTQTEEAVSQMPPKRATRARRK